MTGAEDSYDSERLGQEYIAGRNAHRWGQSRLDCPHNVGSSAHRAWLDGFESHATDAERVGDIAHAHSTEQTLQLVDERIKAFLGGKHGSMTTLQLLDRVFAQVRLGGGTVTVSCRTNIDAFRNVRWPTTLSCVPAIGDRIEGTAWTDNKVIASLRVCGITHSQDRNGDPYLDVELHR